MRNKLQDLIQKLEQKNTPIEKDLYDKLSKDHLVEMLEWAHKYSQNAMAFDIGTSADTLNIKIIPEYCRLPYDVIWIEVVFNTKESCEGVSRVGALLKKVDYQPEVNGRTLEGDNFYKFQIYTLSFGASKTNTWTLSDIGYGSDCKSEEFIAIVNDILTASCMGTISRFLTILKCTNVYVDEQEPGSMSKRKARKYKIPFFSTWTLRIKQRNVLSGSQGGHHASPRVHMRRGHIREYAPDRITWVQPCVVGNKSLGYIHKDYAVDASRQ